MNHGKNLQYISITFSSLAVFVLMYLIKVNFYTPIMEIRGAFQKMSKGDIKERFQRKSEDELKELYDNFNFFLDNLETIFKLEDKIILENQLDDILCYMFSEFSAFIPFKRLTLEYESLQKTRVERIVQGTVQSIEHGVEDQRVEKYDDVTRVGSRIALPIKVGNNNFGTLYLDFDSESDISESYISFTKLLKEKVSFAFIKASFKNLLAIVTGGLSEMTEERDQDTGMHLKRMSLYSQIIAMGLLKDGSYKDKVDKVFIEDILISATMHDIGKVSIPDSILLKPGKLTYDEFEVMKTHTVKGYDVLMHIDKNF